MASSQFSLVESERRSLGLTWSSGDGSIPLRSMSGYLPGFLALAGLGWFLFYSTFSGVEPGGRPMGTEYDLLIRGAVLAVGLWTFFHYMLGAVALTDASNWAKLVLFPALVVSGVSLCFSAVFYTRELMLQAVLVFAVLVSIKDAVIWRAGAYMSEVLARQARMRERLRQARNLYMYDLTSPVDAVNDFLTPSGFDEIKKSEERAKERA